MLYYGEDRGVGKELLFINNLFKAVIYVDYNHQYLVQ